MTLLETENGSLTFMPIAVTDGIFIPQFRPMTVI